MAERARACCASGKFVVATDETNGPLPLEMFDTLPHTDDFSDYGLPSFPSDKVLWWNADYPLYAARRAMPDHDYYVMFEYDVFLNCDVDRIIAQFAEKKQILWRMAFRRSAFTSIGRQNPPATWGMNYGGLLSL